MKVCLYMVLFVVASLFAQTGDAIFSQGYDFAEVDGGLNSASIADDFVPYFSGYCQSIKLWMIFVVSTPSDIYIKITENTGDPNPNISTTLFAGELDVVAFLNGDSIFGYPISEVSLQLPTPVFLAEGELHWLEVGTETQCYWVYREPAVFGYELWVYQAGQYHPNGDDSDGFFELLTPVALERNTWGAIKSSF